MNSLMAPEFWQASGALTALGLAAWLYRRRRISHEPSDNPTDFITTDPAGEVMAPPLAPTLPTPIAALEVPSASTLSPIITDVLDPIWETDVYLRFGRFTQAEALMRDTIRNEPGRDELKQKLFEVLHLANKSEVFAEYFRKLQSENPDLDSAFWRPIQAMRPELFPSARPPIDESPQDSMVRNNEPAPDTIIAEEFDSAPASTEDEPSLQALDMENTDFTAELRALEEASINLQPHHEGAGPITLESDLGADLKNLDGNNDSPEIADIEASTNSLEIDDLVSELIASAGPDSATPEQDETSLLDPDDTGFEEELQTLETHCRDEEPEARPSNTMPLAQASNAVNESVLAEAAKDKDNLLAFDTSDLNLLLNQVTESAPSSELPLENLIPFDISDLDATLAAVSFKPSREESASEILIPLSNKSEMDEFFAVTRLPTLAASQESFGSLDFELELIDPAESTTSKAGEPKASASLDGQTVTETDQQLEEARRLAERNEKSAARALLQEIQLRGNAEQKAVADELLNEITKVRLSLVPPASRKVS